GPDDGRHRTGAHPRTTAPGPPRGLRRFLDGCATAWARARAAARMTAGADPMPQAGREAPRPARAATRMVAGAAPVPLPRATAPRPPRDLRRFRDGCAAVW